MFDANKSEKKLKALRQVLVARRSKLETLERLESNADEWSQGWIAGQKEAYEETIKILDGKILLLEPKE